MYPSSDPSGKYPNPHVPKVLASAGKDVRPLELTVHPTNSYPSGASTVGS